jgi:lysophospholipid acyltransferase (LPLAT)-like uncharacterized protein
MPLQRWLKRIGASRMGGRIASGLIAAYIRVVYRTSRWRYIGREHADPLDAEGRGFIVAFWHQRLLLGAVVRRETDKRVFMLISAHRDGEIIANAVSPFGVELIRGSAANPRKREKGKSGAPALAQMLAALETGEIVGFTPDGPRGPRGIAQPGVIRLAQLSGAPILPAAYSVSRGRFLDTWDRFLLAAPFSRGCFVAREPIRVARDATPEMIEEAREMLQKALTEASEEADRAVGRSPDAAGLR